MVQYNDEMSVEMGEKELAEFRKEMRKESKNCLKGMFFGKAFIEIFAFQKKPWYDDLVYLLIHIYYEHNC